MSVAMKLRELRWRAAGHYRPFGRDWTASLAGATALEIGGPSALFRGDGLLPVYPELERLDGVQVGEAHALWHGDLAEGAYETGEPGLTGRLWLRDGSKLEHLPDGGYDALLSSHVLEHIANPLGALREWIRVLRPGGTFLIVLPHKEGCADHRRPTTTLEHMIEDERDGTGEDDLTHADEVIELHDIARDPPARDPETLRARVMDNPRVRAMHHHVFTLPSALRLLDHAGLEIVRAEARWPHDVYVVARRSADGGRATLSDVLAPAARRSPFRADRAELIEAAGL
jgi:SAM-dependent methyltransferase